MDRFIAHENIRHFRDCLWVESDPAARWRLQKLLVAEEDKLGRLGEALELASNIDRHISDGFRRIERQRVLVDTLKRDGRDGHEMAQALLDGMVETQILHMAYRDRILIGIKQNRLLKEAQPL